MSGSRTKRHAVWLCASTVALGLWACGVDERTVDESTKDASTKAHGGAGGGSTGDGGAGGKVVGAGGASGAAAGGSESGGASTGGSGTGGSGKAGSTSDSGTGGTAPDGGGGAATGGAPEPDGGVLTCTPTCAGTKALCENGKCVECLTGSAQCAANNTPQKCQDGAWVSQTPCGGATSACSNGICSNVQMSGGIVTVAAAVLSTSTIRLVDHGLEFTPTTCGTVQGNKICVTGGLRP